MQRTTFAAVAAAFIACAAPLTAQEREDKFRLCWRLTRPGSEARLEQAIAWLNRLPMQPDLQPLVELLAG